MAKARWGDILIAESDATVMVEGNHYFPREAVRWEHLEASDHRTTCPWKGVAHYHHLRSGEGVERNAAWSYPEPKAAAAEIAGPGVFWKGAFWKGVRVGG